MSTASPIKLVRKLLPRLAAVPNETRRQRILRRVRIGIVAVACLVTLQSVLLVLGALAQRPADRTAHGRRRSQRARRRPAALDHRIVTPDRITYRPELGVLYPSELEDGMRIYVEYDVNNPDLVRVQDRNASLAIVPAGSIAVVGWLIAGAALFGVTLIERRLTADAEQ